MGEKPFRAGQIFKWLHEGVQSFDEMSNLSKELRARLAENFILTVPEVGRKQVSRVDGTVKYLWRMRDGDCVESVLMHYEHGVSVCVSTQVGCPVQCLFCASGRGGLVRNLSAGEMVEEFLLGSRRAGRRPDNIVFMGIGEGLWNFDELQKTLHILSAPEYFGMSPRRITVSTSGYVPGMLKFAELGKEYTLAISLHAPDDETRAKIIPGKVRYPISEIMAAADRYLEKAGRMVTLEYTLLDGINDSPAAAQKMARLAREHHAKINLIPYNATDSKFRRPSPKAIAEFEKMISDAGAHVTVRTERGSENAAACGQLRARHGKHRAEKN